MRTFSFGLVLACLLFAAPAKARDQVALLSGLPVDARLLEEDYAQWRKLSAESRDWRARSLEARGEMKGRLTDGVLTSADLDRLYKAAGEYVRRSRRWQALIDCQGDEAWARMGPALAHNPRERLQSKIALAAALARHDDYQLGVHPWFVAGKSRRLLKSDYPAIDGELDAAVRRFLDPVNRVKVARAVVWHRAEGVLVKDRSPEEIAVDEQIVASAGYAFFTKNLAERAIAEWRVGGHAAVRFVTDNIRQAGDFAASVASGAVGNTVGLVAMRDGWLKSLRPEEKAAFTARFKPLDILLEKTPFRLTDKSIPGHYGHVAVWIGTEAELKEIGVWDEPLVRPYHAKIRGGAGVVEALRPGVELNTFEAFSNIDDLLVVRPAPMSREARREAVLRAFAQLGKEYDFNFNVESDRRIVCSELAFVVFPAVSWPTSEVLGRRSITPDQVAVKALPGGPFSPVVLVHDGVEVTTKLPECLGCLLKEDAAAFRRVQPGFVGKSEM